MIYKAKPFTDNDICKCGHVRGSHYSKSVFPQLFGYDSPTNRCFICMCSNFVDKINDSGETK